MKNKLEPLKLVELDLLTKPKEQEKAVTVDWVKFEEETLTSPPEQSPLTGEHSCEINPESDEPIVYKRDPRFVDLGELTQEEWQEVFGRSDIRKKNL